MSKIEITKGVFIELTKEQLDSIEAQKGNITSFEQIKDYKDACKMLNRIPSPEPTPTVAIKTIARAINKLIDSNTNFPDWSNNEEKKWYPYFTFKGVGLVFNNSGYICSDYDGTVSFVKTEKASNHLAKIALSYYNGLNKEKF